jgi:hypothetical protein
VFSVNYVSYWKGNMADYYPGDEYVDWVGASLYVTNYTVSDSYSNDAYFGRGNFADCVLSLKETVETFGDKKPIIITESGINYVGSDGSDQSAKAAVQMNELYSVLNVVYPQVKAIIYFDRNSPTTTNNYTISQNTAVQNAYTSATSSNSTLVSKLGSSSGSVYMPLDDDFSCSTGTLSLAAYSQTPRGTMTVSYKLNGRAITSSSTAPYYCTIDASTLSVGTHTLTVSFSDGAGYTATKTYKISKLVDGTLTTSTNVEFPSSWAVVEVELAVSEGLIDKRFQSSYTSNITRADFCALVIDLIEAKTGKTIDQYLSANGYTINSSAFKDTSDSDILAANALGIVDGRGGGIFDPNASITRQEAAKMLTVAAKVLGMKTASGSAVSFTDSSTFPSWATDYISFISSVNDKVSGYAVMGGIDGNRFAPTGNYTRQQAYLTMLRLYRSL